MAKHIFTIAKFYSSPEKIFSSCNFTGDYHYNLVILRVETEISKKLHKTAIKIKKSTMETHKKCMQFTELIYSKAYSLIVREIS